ncbi:MAG: Hsp20/alpha crystallin family protein [Candidatus Omnitrophica bacterium]|nr:Hsp20/alpha crystallin family protein [Candidatus Omnitrophota bacterium]
MREKILTWALIILAAVLIFENAYLLGRRHSRESFRKFIPPRQTAENLPVVNAVFPPQAPRVNPFEEANRAQESMSRMLQQAERLNQGNFFGSTFIESSASFNDAGAQYIARLNLEGVKKEEINLQVKDNQLIVSSQVKKETPGQQSLSYSRFFSSFLLPQDADIGQIKTEFKNNVLTITIPKVKANLRKIREAKIPVK